MTLTLFGSLVFLPLMFVVLLWDSKRKKDEAAKDWFVVDEVGFRYSFEVENDAPVANETHVAWKDIVRPLGATTYDVVSVEIGSRNTMGQRVLLFWRHLPFGGIERQRFPFWGCVPPEYQQKMPLQISRRFRNSHDLLRALLYGLAVYCDDLRFDPMVFVHANINPYTWQALHSPEQEAKRYGLAGWIVFFAWCMGGWSWLVAPDDKNGAFFSVFIPVLIAIGTIGIAFRIAAEKWFNAPWGKRPPDWGDVIVFTRDGQVRESNEAISNAP